MRIVFGDTSFFIALLNPKDQLHERALQLRRAIGPFHLITSEMVLTELLNDFSAKGAALRVAATSLVDELRRMSSATPPLATVVKQSPDQFESAYTLYRDRQDKSWSLTDCSSYVSLKEFAIADVLTHDQHFTQMGFRALLRG